LVRTAVRNASLVIARPFNYTGPGHSPDFVVPKLIDHFKTRRSSVRLGNVDVEREYNDVRYVCEAYLRLLQINVSGTFNICSGITYSLTDIVSKLRNLTGHPIRIDIDEALVRPNDIKKLSGDASKLLSAVGPIPTYPIEETLQWMLESE
jgi:GDP-6-deoxy-D-talose 4-dehydrogenase